MQRCTAHAMVLALLLVACESPPMLGGVCTRPSECASPLACGFGRCRSACVVDRDCPVGASCLLDPAGVGSCSLEVDLGCESGVGRACPSGLVCVADRCAQSCGSAIDCVSGSICTEAGGSSFCAPSDVPDAGQEDASTGDAGTDDAGADADVASILAGCVLLLHMDEPSWSGASGEVVDDSGLGNAGTAVGGATTISDSMRGQVGHFTSATCVMVPDTAALDATTALTMSAWIHPVGVDDSAAFGIVSKRTNVDEDDAYDMFLWTNNRVFVTIDGSNDRFDAPVSIVNTTWRHVTVTFDGARPAAGRVRVLIDGVLADVRGETSATIPASTADLAIGCLPASGPAQSFSGDLDDVAVWTRALSDDEAAAWYAATR